ncbi:hypothetical protein HAHE_25710 [Haloferula helveola]|uniref:Cytochrome c domain-containing protein n=1 Tax=Haloferula helveola TaxID=490095 RepID=A0ABN6H503_9BACT|nr:hypothetical protein HAHE_25710 [Haloferula helveola]
MPQSLPRLCLALLAITLPARADGESLYTQTIRPLFAQKCLSCHGDKPEKIKGDFDMRTRDGVLAGGESGDPAVVPGHPERSTLLRAITWTDPDLEMPPKENDRLTAAEVDAVKKWIEAGAPMPEPRADQAELAAGEWTSADASGRVRIGTREAETGDWSRRGYESASVWAFRTPERQEPPASGHPIDAFLNAALKTAGLEPAPKADDAVLRRRIAYDLTGLPPAPEDQALSPDELVGKLLASPHYGERMAQHWLDVTRYADSNGFSKDEIRHDAHLYRSYVIRSFNEDKPYDRFVREQIAGDELGLAGQEALAFLWMGPWEMTNMTSDAVARQNWLDDAVNTVGVTFLGQELRCAKCHDHKFDPIPIRDYYSMQAVFASTLHHRKAGSFEIRSAKPDPIRILKGGALESPGDEVRPGVLSAFAMSSEHPVPDAAKGRRAALANWIADPAHPLTARVMANRIWQWHFGRGLVDSPNVFGVAGSRPSHPELLDWLAVRFIEDGWSVKKMQRLILSSDAYRRAATHPDPGRLASEDPDGKWLATFRPRRLGAEEIRDSMLVVSGELNRKVGGPGFKAEINWEVAFQPRLAMGKLTPPWEPEPKRADRHRRSLYAMRIRNLGHPLMEVFNRPNTEMSCGRRDDTTVVTQAFTLFHSDFSRARALRLADRITKSTEPADRITVAFREVLRRSPETSELKACAKHLNEMSAHHRAHPPERDKLPTKVGLPDVEERTGRAKTTHFTLKGMAKYERDLQAWEVDAETRALAELCLVLFNSSEFLHVY